MRLREERNLTCAVIPADAGGAKRAVIPRKRDIQTPDWMPDQVRYDAEYPAACGGVVHWDRTDEML